MTTGRPERRVAIRDRATLRALAHPVRLDILSLLMDTGPRTASECARAVGDTPSNCSYHLRVLAARGLVEPEPSGDARKRPWRATVTGFTTEADDGPEAAGLAVASLQLDLQIAEEHLRTRAQLPEQWRRIEPHGSYGIRVTADELQDVVERIDAIVRPYIAATRGEAPAGAEVVHLAVLAVPRRVSPRTPG